MVILAFYFGILLRSFPCLW